MYGLSKTESYQRQAVKRSAIKRGTSQLRRTSLKSSPKRLRAVGKKGSEWLTARKWLKKHFGWAGITRCEFRYAGCWYDNGLSFAHCKKRRELLEGEIWHVGLACQSCHSKLDEGMTHEQMHVEVHRIIDKRGLIAPLQSKSMTTSEIVQALQQASA